MRSPKGRFVRCRPVREERVDEVLFLIDQDGKAIHALTSVGAGIWSLLSQPVSMAETKHILKQAFPTVPPRKVARDVEDIFAEFEKYGLIRHAPKMSPPDIAAFPAEPAQHLVALRPAHLGG